MILLNVLLVTLSVQAQLETAYLKKLKSATTHQNVREVREDYQSITESSRICRIQMHDKTVPTGCYRFLDLEKKWKLIDAVAAAEFTKRIDEACESVAVAALNDESEPLTETSAHMSATCRRSLAKAREIRRYRSPEIFSKSDGLDIEITD